MRLFLLLTLFVYGDVPFVIDICKDNNETKPIICKVIKTKNHNNNSKWKNITLKDLGNELWDIQEHSSNILIDKYWDSGTPFFLKFYGNYGGLGNKGGKPWDDLDKVFQKHDYHYGKRGFLDAKSDAIMLQGIPSALFKKNIHKEGYILGPIAFMIFATSIPSIYRTHPIKNITIPIPMPNGAFAWFWYKSEESYKLLIKPKKIEKEIKRVGKDIEKGTKNFGNWLERETINSREFIKDLF